MDTSEAKEIIKLAVSEAVNICGTQSELARKAEITQGAISKYLRGEAMPTGHTAKKLHKAVGRKIPRSRFSPLNC